MMGHSFFTVIARGKATRQSPEIVSPSARNDGWEKRRTQCTFLSLRGRKAVAISKFRIQIIPVWIHGMDQRHLFLSRSGFDLLLSDNSVVDIIKALIINELGDIVFFL